MLEKKESKNVKIASENTINNSLINIDNNFSGLEKVITCFFPSMRNEMILRYRAETIENIGIEAYRLACNKNIQINPIPSKLALPLIEKMSLENEQEMYDKWTKLLIATSISPNPIYQQFANILSNLNSISANLLYYAYKNHLEPDTEILFNNYTDTIKFLTFYGETIRGNKKRPQNDYEKEHFLSFSYDEKHLQISKEFGFPLILHSFKFYREEDNEEIFPIDNNENILLNSDNHFRFSNEDKNMIFGLEKLNLIKYQFLSEMQREGLDGGEIFVERCGILLTQFGYSFINFLEHPEK